MKNPMADYSMLHEDEQSFHIRHPDGSVFPVAKKGISKELHEKIRGIPRFADGGELDANASDAASGDPVTMGAGDTPPDASGSGFPIANDLVSKAASGIGHLFSQALHPFGAPPAVAEAPSPAAEPEATPVADTAPAPAAPPATALPIPDPMAGALSQYDKAFAQQAAGIAGQAAAEKAKGDAQAQAYDHQVRQMQDAQTDWQAKRADLDKRTDQLFQQASTQKIDPHAYWNNKSTGNKILAGIGIFLGGLGGAANGTNKNVVLDQIQQNIQRDIDAQKANVDQKNNLLRQNLEITRNMDDAEKLTESQLNTMVQAQVAQAAAKASGPEAQARAQQLIGELRLKQAELHSQIAMRQVGSNPNAPTGFRIRALVPEKQQEAAFKEYGDTMKIDANLNEANNVFNKITQLQTVASRTGNPIQSMAQINALWDPYVGQLTKDIEGRVTPTDVELIHSLKPKVTDDAQTTMVKLNRLRGMIRSKALPTPIMNAYGITSSGGSQSMAANIPFTPMNAKNRRTVQR